MGLTLTNTLFEKSTSTSDELIKVISKFWNKNQWELYLKQFESSQPKEEIYVGTANDLEKFIAKNSKHGFVSSSNGQDV